MKQESPDPKNKDVTNHEPFESDAKKIFDRHMADPNHVITEEEMKSIRVGVSGEADAPTEEAIEEANDRIADKKSDSEEDTTPGTEKMTPWDVVS